MDHISLPGHPIFNHLIEIPYLVNPLVAYDNRGFLSFPARMNFPLHRVTNGDLGGKTSDELLAFVQSWCYFGLLVEFFKTADIDVDPQEFLKPPSKTNEHQRLVTTVELPNYLLLWELKSRKPGRAEWRVRMRTCSEYLEKASQLVREIGHLENETHGRHFSSTRDLDKDALKTWREVHLSAIILGEQLHTALRACYGADSYPHGAILLFANNACCTPAGAQVKLKSTKTKGWIRLLAITLGL
jgi:hypothetical protein